MSEIRQPEPEPTTAELVDMVMRRIVTALVIAAALIALAIYARPAPPRFQAVAAPDGRILRIDTRSGTILACEGRRCMRVVQRGQSLVRELPAKALPAPAPATQPRALPAPTPAPAPSPTQ